VNTEVKPPRAWSGVGWVTTLLRVTCYRWLEYVVGSKVCVTPSFLFNCSAVQVSKELLVKVTPSCRMGRKADGPLGTFRQE
jgi:hypothetical protein